MRFQTARNATGLFDGPRRTPFTAFRSLVRLAPLSILLAHSFTRSFLFVLTAFTVIASFLLGGGTRSGMVSDAILELLALPLLLCGLWRWRDIPADRRPRSIFILCAASALLLSMQLLPLPPALWTMLPHRQPIIESIQSIQRDLPWMPMSVDPLLTLASLLTMIAPLSVFIAASCLEGEQRRHLALLILPMSAVSVFLGLLQVAQGEDSPLRFFNYTNPTEAVGFFANRNHFSAFLYCAILFASTWLAETASKAAPADSKHRFEMTSFVAATAAATLIVILLSGQAMARSRAGIALTLLALIGAIAIAYAKRRDIQANGSSNRLLLGAITVGAILPAPFALYRVLDRFDAGMFDETRWAIAIRAMDAARTFFPFGAGIGTFVPVYAGFERPEDAVVNAYVNHAHNDLLELFLESGVIGVGVAAAFVGWWARSSWRIWRGPSASRLALEEPYARAATLAVALLLLHSLVDYPLRTATMTTIFALACALMIDPPLVAANRQRDHSDDGPSRRKSAKAPPTRPISIATPNAEAPRPRASAAPVIDWPTEPKGARRQTSVREKAE
ncbi:O-antigen ligase family protein [Methylosinus sporium]|uniref:O-antigen ligase family protein n=1 Tax=Methylosinus sporium TaxID=428 RepID=A0A549T4I9_METSR|nr:O-antigen ligase family protein [Methylosinus sporium]